MFVQEKRMDRLTYRYFVNLEKRLVFAKRVRPLADNDWTSSITKNAGAYALWDILTNKPIYVGETASLQQRMADIDRTVNHTFRGQIARLRKWALLDEKQLSFHIS
jgi:hypothetical protein